MTILSPVPLPASSLAPIGIATALVPIQMPVGAPQSPTLALRLTPAPLPGLTFAGALTVRETNIPLHPAAIRTGLRFGGIAAIGPDIVREPEPAPHPRDLLAKFAVDLLRHRTMAAARVWDQRLHPLHASDTMPAIQVSVTPGQATPRNPAGDRIWWVLSETLVLTAVVARRTDWHGWLHRLVAQIEPLILSAPWRKIGARIDDRNTEIIGADDGELPFAAAQIRQTVVFNAWKHTPPPGLPLDGLNLAVDVIDPAADPNRRYPGPDGRIELTSRSST